MASRFTITVSCGSFTLSSLNSTATNPGLSLSANKLLVVGTVYSPLLAVDAGSTRMFTLVATASVGDASMLTLVVPLVRFSLTAAEAASKVRTGLVGVPVVNAQAPLPLVFFARTRTR